MAEGSLPDYEDHRESKDGFHKVPNGIIRNHDYCKESKDRYQKVPNGNLQPDEDRKRGKRKIHNGVSSNISSAAYFTSLTNGVERKKFKMDLENGDIYPWQSTSLWSNPQISPLSIVIQCNNIEKIKINVSSAWDSEIAAIEQQEQEVETVILQEVRKRLESKYKGKTLGVVAGFKKGRSILIVYTDALDSDVIDENEHEFCGRTFILKNPKRIPQPSSAKVQTCKLTPEQIELAKQIINDNADDLWARHSNLNIITTHAVPEEGVDGMPRCCIFLYCTSKGIIPLGEKEFPKTLRTKDKKDELIVKVGDGFFEFCPSYNTSHSKNYHQDLKMGCSISSIPQQGNGVTTGTIGPFVDLDGKLGFLTCAHVLFNIIPSGDFKFDGQTSPSVEIIQPEKGTLFQSDRSDKPCGRVFKALFKEQSDVSIDVAAVLIEDTLREPIEGRFAVDTEENYKEMGFDDLPVFNSGRHIDTESVLYSRKVVKCGKSTHFTMGIAKCSGTQVRSGTFEFNGSDKKFVMKNQIEIESYKPNAFLLPGDSGSAVFQMNDDKSLECIGMVIGATSTCSNHTAIVTPICPILDALDVRLKTFE